MFNIAVFLLFNLIFWGFALSHYYRYNTSFSLLYRYNTSFSRSLLIWIFIELNLFKSYNSNAVNWKFPFAYMVICLCCMKLIGFYQIWSKKSSSLWWLYEDDDCSKIVLKKNFRVEQRRLFSRRLIPRLSENFQNK